MGDETYEREANDGTAHAGIRQWRTVPCSEAESALCGEQCCMQLTVQVGVEVDVFRQLSQVLCAFFFLQLLKLVVQNYEGIVSVDDSIGATT